MNERAVEVLVAAALAGVPQVRWMYANEHGRCAMGVLIQAAPNHSPQAAVTLFDLTRLMYSPCDCELWHIIGPAESEAVIVHLNDQHGWSFLDIARKLAPSPEAA